MTSSQQTPSQRQSWYSSSGSLVTSLQTSTDARTASSTLQKLLIKMDIFSLAVRYRQNVLHTSICLPHIAVTWFRVLVKMAARDANSSYTWHEMTFCSRWTSGRCAILCIGACPLFRELLQDALVQLEMKLSSSEPYSLHVPLVEAVVALQEVSVWSVRDIVRGIEKASTFE